MFEKIFLDVLNGKVSTQQAGNLVHVFCNTQGLNPALKTPVSMLMTSETGRLKMQTYETFLMNMNWLIAKLSANAISLELATEEFLTFLADLNEQMFVRYREEEKKQEKDLDNYFREISCPSCGLYGKPNTDYQDFYSVEA